MTAILALNRLLIASVQLLKFQAIYTHQAIKLLSYYFIRAMGKKTLWGSQSM